MLPVVESRGAVPVGYASGMGWIPCMLLCILGNFLPVPFILLFIRALLKRMKKNKYLHKAADWLINKAHKNTKKVLKYASFGLIIFVAVPLPGTGAWTAALIAALMDMRLKYAAPSIFTGVVIAAFIITGVVYGFLDFLRFILI